MAGWPQLGLPDAEHGIGGFICMYRYLKSRGFVPGASEIPWPGLEFEDEERWFTDNQADGIGDDAARWSR